jgi:A/G-specific adenine glycosylase
MITDVNLRSEFQSRLLNWFETHKRDLPFRKKKPNPYHIFVVEVMLQQTQIKTVIPYYHRWFKTFSTVESLAQAPIDRVLKLWEGLGYYTRARNLHKAAKMIVDEFGGKIPNTVNELMRLPGIGRYTAGAISSIGFGKPAPIVDGNVARVFARLFNVKKDILNSDTQKYFYELAAQLVPEKEPGTFNQALMELGSLVCISEIPKCEICPVRNLCLAYKNKTQLDLPVRKNKTEIKKIEMVVGIIEKNSRILIRKRPPYGIWGGLWEIPGTVRTKGQTPEEALMQEFQEALGLKIKIQKTLPQIVHHLTHRNLMIYPYVCLISEKQKRGQASSVARMPVPVLRSMPKNTRWASQCNLKRFSFPVPHQNILKRCLTQQVVTFR